MNAFTPVPFYNPASAFALATAPTTVGEDFEFDFDGTRIRGRVIDGDAWIVATEVATSLGHRNASDLTRHLDDDEKGTHPVRTPGGVQTVLFVSEAGLFRAILQRRGIKKLPGATRERIERFQRRVFHDVLPQIQRTGSYVPEPQPVPAPVAIDVRDPSHLAIITTQLIGLNAELQAALEDRTRQLGVETHARQVTTVALSEAHGRIEAERPKVLAHDRLAASGGLVSLSEAAVTLMVDRGSVVDHLLALGYLTRQGARNRARCTREGVRAGWVRQVPELAEVDDRTEWKGQPMLTPAGVTGLTAHFCRGVTATRQPVLPGV